MSMEPVSRQHATEINHEMTTLRAALAAGGQGPCPSVETPRQGGGVQKRNPHLREAGSRIFLRRHCRCARSRTHLSAGLDTSRPKWTFRFGNLPP
jgi:hypothetical protein